MSQSPVPSDFFSLQANLCACVRSHSQARSFLLLFAMRRVDEIGARARVTIVVTRRGIAFATIPLINDGVPLVFASNTSVTSRQTAPGGSELGVISV